MFPHTVTIYHHSTENGRDKYSFIVKEGFYWNDKISLAVGNKGAETEKATTIISSPENAAKYGTEWTVQVNDMVMLGKGGEIKSFKELNGAVTVTGIAVNVCGCEVDNVVITGK